MSYGDGMTSYERLLANGYTPCPQCIWFRGEVTTFCVAHQLLADEHRNRTPDHPP